MRSSFSWGTLLCAALGAWQFGDNAAPAADARQPNIVVILVDDLGYADLGCHGSPDIRTPNIDALAAAGIRCTDGYAAAPVGGPSRAALLTGRYPQRYGHEFNPPRDPKARYGLPAGETTLAQVLQDAGYATGLVGKWQLGQEKEFHPQRRGFQEFFGFLGGAHYYLKQGAVTTAADNPVEWPNGIMRGTKLVEEKEYLTDAFTREAADFIERKKAAPFFLMLSYNAPHAPYEIDERRLNRVVGNVGGDHRRRVYAAMIAALDDGIGAVTAKLKSAGLTNDTLIFFLGDNGAITGYLGPGSNAPLSGAKPELLEGGVRVPFLVAWPGRIPAGGAYGSPVSLLDVFATAAAAGGAKLPAGRGFDGVDLLPHFTGVRPQPPHSLLYWRYGPQSAVRDVRYKLLKSGKEPIQLYDLSVDPTESKDLAADKPDVVARLSEQLKSWDAQLVPPAWNKPNTVPWW